MVHNYGLITIRHVRNIFDKSQSKNYGFTHVQIIQLVKFIYVLEPLFFSDKCIFKLDKNVSNKFHLIDGFINCSEY